MQATEQLAPLVCLSTAVALSITLSPLPLAKRSLPLRLLSTLHHPPYPAPVLHFTRCAAHPLPPPPPSLYLHSLLPKLTLLHMSRPGQGSEYVRMHAQGRSTID